MIYAFEKAAVNLGSIFYSNWCLIRKRMQKIWKCATNTSVPAKEEKPSESVDVSGFNWVLADIRICHYNPPPILLVNELLQEMQKYHLSASCGIQTLHLLL